jgi:hypothetical protein
MKCPNCGEQVPTSAKVCGYCGNKLNFPEKRNTNLANNRESSADLSRNIPNGVWIMAGLLVLAVAIVGSVYVFPEWYGLTRPDESQSQSQISSFTTPTPKTISESSTASESAVGGGQSASLYDCAEVNANELYGTFDETPRLALTGDNNKQIVIEPTEKLLVYFGWEATDDAYLFSFVEESEIQVEVNGAKVQNTWNCWTSPIQTSTGTQVEYWILPLDVVGEEIDFYFLLSLKNPISDGFDLDENGEPDVYFNDWEYKRTIITE